MDLGTLIGKEILNWGQEEIRNRTSQLHFRCDSAKAAIFFSRGCLQHDVPWVKGAVKLPKIRKWKHQSKRKPKHLYLLKINSLW